MYIGKEKKGKGKERKKKNRWNSQSIYKIFKLEWEGREEQDVHYYCEINLCAFLRELKNKELKL